MGRAPEPPGEECPRRSRITVLPERAEPFLERPRPAHLEVLLLQDAQDLLLLGRQLRRTAQPQVLRAREPLISLPLEAAVLAAPHPVHRFVQMLDHMELVEHDLAVRVGQVRAGGLHVGLPHIHGHRGDPVALRWRERRPEGVQARLLAVVSEVQDAAPVQIRHDRQVPMPLGDRLPVDT